MLHRIVVILFYKYIPFTKLIFWEINFTNFFNQPEREEDILVFPL